MTPSWQSTAHFGALPEQRINEEKRTTRLTSGELAFETVQKYQELASTRRGQNEVSFVGNAPEDVAVLGQKLYLGTSTNVPGEAVHATDSEVHMDIDASTRKCETRQRSEREGSNLILGLCVCQRHIAKYNCHRETGILKLVAPSK